MSPESKDLQQRESSRAALMDRIRFVADKYDNRVEAAKAAAVSKSTLQTWIDGSRSPSFEALARLAGEAGVSLDWIATGVGGDADAPSLQPEPFDRSLLRINRELIDNIVGGFSDLYDSIGLGYDADQPISSASLYNLYNDLIQIEDRTQRSIELVRALQMQESIVQELYDRTLTDLAKIDKARASN